MGYNMVNIAAVLNDLGPSQKAFYLIKEFNKAIKDTKKSVCVFFERPSVPVTKPLFACSNISFFSGYHDIAISTNLHEAETLLKSYNKSDKYLYLWDIDWLEKPVYYKTAQKIILNDRLKIIARSKDHANVIENFCNKSPEGIVDNWRLDQLNGVTNADR